MQAASGHRLLSSRHCSTSSASARVALPRQRTVFARAAADERAPSNANVCKTCGADQANAPGGCDGEGRILGGLGAVPGFGWWPIKAYRPCPGLESAGVEYTRKGQATNEVLFGGVSLGTAQQETLEQMQKVQDKGLDVDI